MRVNESRKKSVRVHERRECVRVKKSVRVWMRVHERCECVRVHESVNVKKFFFFFLNRARRAVEVFFSVESCAARGGNFFFSHRARRVRLFFSNTTVTPGVENKICSESKSRLFPTLSRLNAPYKERVHLLSVSQSMNGALFHF